MAKKVPIVINGLSTYCIYNYNITKSDDLDVKQSETGDEILYLYRRDVYSINVSIKCTASVGNTLDSYLTSSVVIPVTFWDMDKQVSRSMRVESYSYSCISMCGSEIWDVSLKLQESCR